MRSDILFDVCCRRAQGRVVPLEAPAKKRGATPSPPFVDIHVSVQQQCLMCVHSTGIDPSLSNRLVEIPYNLTYELRPVTIYSTVSVCSLGTQVLNSRFRQPAVICKLCLFGYTYGGARGGLQFLTPP